MQILLVGVAGAFGAAARYGITFIFPPTASFPYATLVANLAGCFIFTYFVTNGKIPKSLRTAITTGFLGAFTTFSAFSAETFTLLQSHAYITAFSYMMLTLLGGLLLSYWGMRKGEKRWAM